MTFNLVPFGPVGRPSTLEDFLVMKPVPDDGSNHLYLQCSKNVAKQFASLPYNIVPSDVFPPEQSQYDFRFDWPDGMPSSGWAFAKLLQKVLTMGRMQYVSTALALDWYKVPPTPEQPDWTNTITGARVNCAKYWSECEAVRVAKTKIVENLKAVIALHPTLTTIPTIVTVPGSKADGNSFGERLARHMATTTAKAVVQTQSRSGPREQRKGGSQVDLMGEFVMPTSLTGPVLIVDDVFMSGASMDATALAARQAGASDVYGLAIAKTRKG